MTEDTQERAQNSPIRNLLSQSYDGKFPGNLVVAINYTTNVCLCSVVLEPGEGKGQIWYSARLVSGKPDGAVHPLRFTLFFNNNALGGVERTNFKRVFVSHRRRADIGQSGPQVRVFLVANDTDEVGPRPERHELFLNDPVFSEGKLK